MKIIKVKGLKEASKKAYELTNFLFEDKKKYNIFLTGGRFGENFSDFLISLNKTIKNKDFFLTDERITNKKSEKNFDLILKKIKKSKILNNNNFYRLEFPEKKNSYEAIKKLDLVFLSLGEDGHLAGHFFNSKNLNNRVCYTENASSLPPERLSYRIDFLAKAELIILIIIGDEKKQAFDFLLKNKNIHSESILNSKKIITLTDICNIS